METSPCYQCTDRHDLCHGHCERYLEFRKRYEAEMNEYRTQKKMENWIEGMHIRACKQRKPRKRDE